MIARSNEEENNYSTMLVEFLSSHIYNIYLKGNSSIELKVWIPITESRVIPTIHNWSFHKCSMLICSNNQ